MITERELEHGPESRTRRRAATAGPDRDDRAAYPRDNLVVEPMATAQALKGAIEAAWAARPLRKELHCTHCWGVGRQDAIRAIEQALGVKGGVAPR